MHHPGPPRFVAVGDEVELAPRDPDPSASYRWRVQRAPDGSTASLGDDPVEHLRPDAPGTYTVELAAPDGRHTLTVRAFPATHSPSVDAGHSGGEHTGTDGRVVPETREPDEYARESVAEESGSDRPRLTLEPRVEGDEAVVRAAVSGGAGPGEPQPDLDVEFFVDDRDDIDPAALAVSGGELRIPVAALSDRARIYAVAVSETGYSVPDAAEFTRDDDSGDTAGVQTSQPYHPPAWAEDAVIYEIYVRTFAGTDTEGRTFDELVDRLDYIESLGVDVLWLTPVLENDHAPHGYNIRDFFAIASDLGSREDYERFVEAAHDRGLKVLFDLVCNHSARTHPFFEAAVENPDSEYRDWYEWRTDTDPETYFDWEHIANFDFDHLPVRRHLLDAVAEWAPLVDGFRCDMAWAVPDGFWRELHDTCKARDSEFLLLDETIPYIPDFQGGCFDMHFDSTTYAALRRVGTGSDAEQLLDAIADRSETGFPHHAAFMLYAENHDETRYIVDCGRPAAKAAAGALFTLPGAPLLYAGQEFGQRGRRDDLAWDHADDALREHMRSLAAARHDQPALAADADLARVEYEVLDSYDDRVVAYARQTDDAAAVVALNFGENPATVALPSAADTTDLVSGTAVDAPTGRNEPTVTVDSVVVLPAARGAHRADSPGEE